MPSHYSGTAREARTLDVYFKLPRCTNSIFARLAEHKTVGDLTYSQFAVLEALLHLGSMTQGDISQKILKSGSNLTTVIDNLERDGLVRRERNTKDRRIIFVHLTEKGKKKVEAVLPGHVKALVHEFSVLTAQEQETLASLCKKLGKPRSIRK